MTNSTDILKIETPENVSFDYSVAGIGSRFLAAMLDTAIITLLQAIVIGGMAWVLMQTSDFSLTDSFGDEEPSSLYYWVIGLMLLLSFVFYWGYYIFFETLWSGQTPGKRLVDIRVIRLDGTPVAVTEIIIRNLVRTIDLLPMAYGVGVVTMFVSQKSRRLGDLAAGTLVVREKQDTKLSEVTHDRQFRLSMLSPRTSLPPEFPIESVTADDVSVIEEYLLRRYQLANRQQLAVHILKSIRERLAESAFASLDSNDADDLLAAIYTAWKQRYTQAEQ